MEGNLRCKCKLALLEGRFFFAVQGHSYRSSARRRRGRLRSMATQYWGGWEAGAPCAIYGVQGGWRGRMRDGKCAGRWLPNVGTRRLQTAFPLTMQSAISLMCMAIVRGRRLGGGEGASVPWLRSIGTAGKPALHALFTGCKEAGGGESGMGNVQGDSYQMSARGGCKPPSH